VYKYDTLETIRIAYETGHKRRCKNSQNENYTATTITAFTCIHIYNYNCGMQCSTKQFRQTSPLSLVHIALPEINWTWFFSHPVQFSYCDAMLLTLQTIISEQMMFISILEGHMPNSKSIY